MRIYKLSVVEFFPLEVIIMCYTYGRYHFDITIITIIIQVPFETVIAMDCKKIVFAK